MTSHPTWVRGLKPREVRDHVAIVQSHPTWVRGLKPREVRDHVAIVQSHPTWVRGLKPSGYAGNPRCTPVAPHVGAWIETVSKVKLLKDGGVAPHVGAWIETPNSPPLYLPVRRRTPRGCVD